jgi:hypothetical protein
MSTPWGMIATVVSKSFSAHADEAFNKWKTAHPEKAVLEHAEKNFKLQYRDEVFKVLESHLTKSERWIRNIERVLLTLALGFHIGLGIWAVVDILRVQQPRFFDMIEDGHQKTVSFWNLYQILMDIMKDGGKEGPNQNITITEDTFRQVKECNSQVKKVVATKALWNTIWGFVGFLIILGTLFAEHAPKPGTKTRKFLIFLLILELSLGVESLIANRFQFKEAGSSTIIVLLKILTSLFGLPFSALVIYAIVRYSPGVANLLHVTTYANPKEDVKKKRVLSKPAFAAFLGFLANFMVWGLWYALRWNPQGTQELSWTQVFG